MKSPKPSPLSMEFWLVLGICSHLGWTLSRENVSEATAAWCIGGMVVLGAVFAATRAWVKR